MKATGKFDVAKHAGVAATGPQDTPDKPIPTIKIRLTANLRILPPDNGRDNVDYAISII